jgi:NADH dehydrogenase
VVLRNQKNARVFLAEVIDFDLTNRQLILTDGKIGYDTLIIASGSGFHYFGHDEWQPLAPGLKTVEDATDIRRRIFQAFEAAERETDPDRRRDWLTFIIVGVGLPVWNWRAPWVKSFRMLFDTIFVRST